MNYVIMGLVGLAVGLVARFIYPGAVHLALIPSALLGIAGSYLAGFIGGKIHKPTDGQSLHPAGFLYSVLGALLLIFVARHVLHIV